MIAASKTTIKYTVQKDYTITGKLHVRILQRTTSVFKQTVRGVWNPASFFRSTDLISELFLIVAFNRYTANEYMLLVRRNAKAFSFRQQNIRRLNWWLLESRNRRRLQFEYQSRLSRFLYTLLLLPLKLFFLFLWEFFYSNLFFLPLFLSIAILTIFFPSQFLYIFLLIQSLTSLLFPPFLRLNSAGMSPSLCVSVCTYILMGNSIRDGLQRAEGSLSDFGCRGEGN